LFLLLAGINADGKALPAVFAGVSVCLLGMWHSRNIENDMVPVALLKMAAIRTSGFYPNPVTLASDNNTVIY
jgi:hypothetical protein